MSSEDT
jgi:hypothetical protein